MARNRDGRKKTRDSAELRQAWAEREARQRAARAATEAAFPEPVHPEEAWAHFQRMMTYEGWLEAGQPEPDDYPVDQWPPIYLRFMEEWPDAFQFYRHHAFSYVSRALGFLPWGQVAHSFSSRLRSADPEGYERLLEVLHSADERFQRQRQQSMKTLYLTPLPTEPAERLRVALSAYCGLYETDLPLWFLGVIGNGIRNNQVDPDFFGGPATRTAQASLIDAVQALLEGTPLGEPFRASYDPILRNAVSHNDFELTERDGNILVVDHETGTEWTADEAWLRVEAAQHTHNAVLLAVQLAMTRLLEPPVAFRDVGVISATYQESDSVGPIVILPQLWCFRDLDPDGLWLDEATLTITTGPDGGSGRLTENATTSGPAMDSSYAETLEERGWITVMRVPVAPAIGLDLPKLTTVDQETFEVVGARDEHVIPVEIVVKRDE